jgi:hypothetical protein
MRMAAFAAMQAAFETALAYDSGDEGRADQLMNEFVDMATAMDAILPDITAQGARLGLIRLSWEAFLPGNRIKPTSDTPERLRSEVASTLVKQLIVSFDVEDLGRTNENAEEYMRQKGLGVTPDVTMQDMVPRRFELADFIKMVNYPDDGVAVSTVDLARVAVRSMLGARPLAERWWLYAQFLVDAGRF